MNLDKENIKKIRGLIVFTAILIAAFWQYKVVIELAGVILTILFPFLLGGAIAFILNVPMSFIEKKLFKKEKDEKKSSGARLTSLILTILFVIGIIAIVVFIVFPKLGSTFLSLGKSVQEFLLEVQSWLEDIFENNKEIVKAIENVKFDWPKVLDSVISFFKVGAGSVLGSTVMVAKSIVSGLTTFAIAFVFAIYILLQKEKLHVQFNKILYAYVKKDYADKILSVCTLTYKTFSNFLTGQCVEAVILGAMFVVTMSILRIPYALLVGILISFTALIPIFGAFIGLVVGAFLILVESPIKALIFVIMFFVLQQLEGNLVYPKVVGSSVGLPSIWVLAAVSIGGSLMGIVGMLIFIPIVSVIYALFRGHVYHRLEKKGIIIDNTTGEYIKK